MHIIDELLTVLPEGTVQQVQVGAFWTAVVVNVQGQRRCGLASTLNNQDHHHNGKPAVQDPGQLGERSGRDLARLAHSESLMERSIGMAAINALLSPQEGHWTDINAEAVIAHHGTGRPVALVGHFPFIPRLRRRVGKLWVLEQIPRGDDLPAEAAASIIPKADVVAITGTAIINGTFEELVALCRPGARVLLLGPSTPLSDIMFDHGIHLLSGAVVEDVEAVLQAAGQGANFRQLHRRGVRLVTMQKGE